MPANDNYSEKDCSEFVFFFADLQNNMGWNDAVAAGILNGLMIDRMKKCGFSKGQIIAFISDCYDGLEKVKK